MGLHADYRVKAHQVSDAPLPNEGDLPTLVGVKGFEEQPGLHTSAREGER